MVLGEAYRGFLNPHIVHSINFSLGSTVGENVASSVQNHRIASGIASMNFIKDGPILCIPCQDFEKHENYR